MNRVAGLIGGGGNESVRSERLRKALASAGDDVTISHPLPNVSLAWCGDAGLTAMVENQDRFVLVYGSAYSIAGAETERVSVDDVEGLAKHLFNSMDDLNGAASGLAGSFLLVCGGKDRGVFLAGDSSGNRTLYYAVHGDELSFSSQPLACARLRGEVQINREYEDFFLIYGFYPDGQSVYRGILMLAAQSCLERVGHDWILSETAGPKKFDYSTNGSRETLAEDRLYDRLYEEMLSCVQDQVCSAEDVGVLLGGFDSALVAAMLHRLGKRVHTYSFRYSEESYNQPYTGVLSDRIGSRHHWIDITPEVIAGGLSQYAEQFTQPTNWLNYLVQTVYVCKQMRQDGIVYAYSGDGCDTLFLGYPGTYKRTQAFARLPQLPESLVSILVCVFGSRWLDRSIGHPYRVAMGLLRAMSRPMPARAFLTFRVMDEVTVNDLRGKSEPVNEEMIERKVRKLAEPFGGLSIQRLGYAAKSMVSPNRAKLMASTDAAGVRIHSPYLHPGLRKFAASIPDDLLREEIQSDVRDPGKICLARMAERQGLLPPEVIYQPKLAAIDSPIDDWFGGDLRPQIEKAVAELPFRPGKRQIDRLIRTTWAERFYKDHIGSTRVISDAISLLATYGAMCAAAKRTKSSE
jgi:asparagine synthetase B (glutamine-hydrolysing)